MNIKNALLLSLLLPIATIAQETKIVTLDQAIELGLKNSKQLVMTDGKRNAAKAKYDQQRFTTIPVLSLNSSYLYNSPNVDEAKFATGPGSYQLISMTLHNQNQNRASLSQIIFAGLRGYNIINSTKNLMRAADLDAEKDKNDIKNNITIAYYNHLKLKESKKIVDENMKVLQQRKADMDNLQKVGMALQNDVLKVELAILNLQQNIADVQSAIDISNYNLCVALGLPETTSIECAEAGLFQSKAAADKQAFFQQSLTNRNDLKAANYRLEASKSLVKASKSGYSPTISAGANLYYSNPNQRVFLVPENNKGKYYYSWDIGVSLTWNLTNLFTTTYQTREAKANQKQTEAMTQQLADGVKMEVNSNYSSYKLALDKIDIAKKTVEKSREDQRITKNQYDNGLKNISDMLDVDNSYTTSQINLTNAKIDAEVAYVRLMKAAGN